MDGNDQTGRGAEGFFLDQDPGSSGKSPEELFHTGLTGEQLAAQGFPTEPVVTVLEPPTGLDPFFDTLLTGLNSQGVFPSTITFLDVFFPAGFSQLGDRDARKQGQWGVALRYFADALESLSDIAEGVGERLVIASIKRSA